MNVVATLDSCTAKRLQEIYETILALKDNFISADYNKLGITWRVVDGKKVGYRQYMGWEEKRSINFQVLYERIITYSGSTMYINLDFPVNVMLNRIEMISSDDTAKTYEIREFTDYNNDSNYNLLKKGTANQVTRWFKPYRKHFLPAGSRIQFYFSDFTAAKTNKIIVGVEEI